MDAEVLERWRSADERWWGHVRRAAARAPGGQALWLPGSGDDLRSRSRLPDGFEWVRPDPSDVAGLPEGRYRFVVDPAGGPGAAARLRHLLEPGGIAAVRGPISSVDVSGLRVLSIADELDPPLAILRRED